MIFKKFKKNKPNISEPVYAIAEALKERPKSFYVVDESVTDEEDIYEVSTKVKDKITGEVFVLIKSHIVCNGTIKGCFCKFIPNEDEQDYLYGQFEKWLHNKKERINQKKRNRVKRKYGC